MKFSTTAAAAPASALLLLAAPCPALLSPRYPPAASRPAVTARRRSTCLPPPSSLHMVAIAPPPARSAPRTDRPPHGDAAPSDGGAPPAAPPAPVVRRRPLSEGALYHRRRRAAILAAHPALRSLEVPRAAPSASVGVPLLILANAAQAVLAVACGRGRWGVPAIAAAAFAVGSACSLWQLQILHDCVHGTLLGKWGTRTTVPPWTVGRSGRDGTGRRRRVTLADFVLFWGSLPSVFGYYLYLKFGHLTHHANHGSHEGQRTDGDGDRAAVDATLAAAFASPAPTFEDGDVLFTSHRMQMRGKAGPEVAVGNRTAVVSVSRAAFGLWTAGRPLRNALVYTSSFLFERAMLQCNDAVVALTGRNAFFPNKPPDFHAACAAYCRAALLVRAALYAAGGWRAWLFLYLSESLWCLPPHPACAMFVTNHGSGEGRDREAGGDGGGCVPTSSTYAGRWYAALTLGTNYHTEHHDFPAVPFHRLGELRAAAPEFYRGGRGATNGDGRPHEGDNLFDVVRRAFAEPQFYSCMDAGVIGGPLAEVH